MAHGMRWNRTLIDLIRSHIDAGFGINDLNRNGRTMLSYAAEFGSLGVTEFLVTTKGADANLANADGVKPLHIAAKYGHKGVVYFLLNQGISADSCDYNECTALHYIAQSEIASAVSRENYRQTMHFLVDSGGDINAVNREGYTPLLLACKRSNRYIAELLVELGAKVDCCDEEGWTVLHYSCCRGWTGIVQYLINGRFGGIDLNGRTLDGNSPLLLATNNSSEELFELLIKSGATDFDTIDQLTVLDYSCFKGWLNLVKYLVSTGYDVNAKDNGERKRRVTPLELAADFGHCGSLVEFLIESGANFEELNVEGALLTHASREGWFGVVKSLVTKGSDINAQNSSHNTALHFAVSQRHTEIVRYLLEAGADFTLKNKHNVTAFRIIFEYSLCYLEGIILFIEHGEYLQPNDYNVIINTPLLKAGILRDVKLCTQLVINQFNNGDLPKFYKIPGVAERLPRMEKMNIAYNRHVVQDIAARVTFEIETKGYCDLMNACPIMLSNLCLSSLFKYCAEQ